MTLLSPLWLLLLLPWALACVRAGGRAAGRPAGVPFLSLWPDPPAAVAPRRRRPPLWTILLLAAALLAILAAAGPAVWRPASRVTIVVDRSPAMTPGRLKAAAALLRLPTRTRVRLVSSPSTSIGEPEEIASADLPDALGRLGRNEGDVNALRRTIAAAAAAGGPVVVLTDRPPNGPPRGGPPDGDPPGVVRVAPPPLVNAGIDHFAVVGGDRPEALVRVFNGTPRRRAVLRVDAVRLAVDLPPAGETRDYVLDLPMPGAVSEAGLLGPDGNAWADDVAADDRAFVARTTRPVRVEPREPLSSPLARFAAVYARRRPGADPLGVAVVRGDVPAAGPTSPDGVDDNDGENRRGGPAVALATPLRPAGATPGDAGRDVVVDATHPVSRSLTPALLNELARAVAPPAGEGWRTLARDAAGPLLAVRERPARQVWVGFDADALADAAAFVVFWADTFDWAGGGEPAWAAGDPRPGLTPVDRRDPTSPDAGSEIAAGLYRDAAGRTVAVATPAVQPTPFDAGRPPAALPGVAARTARSAAPLAPVLLLVALGLTAAGLWAGCRLTDF